MSFLLIFAFAFAVNIDCFVAGISYGIQKILLPLRSMIVVASISGCMVWISMLIGRWAAGQVPAKFVDILASLVLASIGFYRIISVIRNNKRQRREKTGLITSFRIPFFCIAIQILHAPEEADINSDGTVDSKDAVMLGVALALDVTAGGFGAALAGFPLIATSIVTGSLSFVLLYLALSFGKFFSCFVNSHAAGSFIKQAMLYLPGIILIILALWRIL